MIILLKKYMSLISLLALLVVLSQFPTTMHAISVILLSVSLTIAFSFTIKKHRGAYLQNKITRDVFVRNVLIGIGEYPLTTRIHSKEGFTK